MNYIGDFTEDETIYTMFNTFTSNDPAASCTITNFVNTDVHIHKDDGTTQRNNAVGITVSTNFDGITGSHMIKIDTNDNTVGGFWVAGHDYFVRIEGTTVDAATINAMVCHFSIENRFMRGTDSAATATALSTHDGKLDTCDGVCDGIQTDLSNATDGLGALKTLVDACNTTTPPTVGAIRTEMEGAGSKLLAIEGYTDKIDDATNGLTAIKAEVEGLGGAAMRGTDSAALAATALTDTMWTDAKAGYIDAAITSRNATTPPTVGAIRTEMEGVGTKLTFTLEDTDDLQGNQGAWATATSVTVSDKTGFSLSTAGIKAVWDQLTNVLTTVGSAGKLIVDNLNGTITSRAPANEYDTEMARLDVDVSSRNATTPPTVGEIDTELTLSHGASGWTTATATALSAQGKLDVNAECDTALSDIKLDHLVNIAVDTDWGTTVHLDSVIGHIADVGTAATFDRTVDALEAIRNQGDAAWTTATATALSAQGKLDVNAEIVDVMTTDTTAEMAQGAPPAVPTFEEMISYIYFSLRNKVETTATENAVYNNAGDTKLFKAVIGDNGTTFSKDTYVSGV